MATGVVGRRFHGRYGSHGSGSAGDWSGRTPPIEWRRGDDGEPSTAEVYDYGPQGCSGHAVARSYLLSYGPTPQESGQAARSLLVLRIKAVVLISLSRHAGELLVACLH
jgi:hypothetical protein